MPIDKDKIAKNALRFIQKGQFQKAIEEYRKALSSDSRDIRTRLKLIDLYGRAGKKKEAIDECLQVAESYSDQGFYLKAIAVYKQALRIDTENPVLYHSMGELYLRQGLVGDALAAFKKGVDILRGRGQSTEAEQLLSRMDEMAPENVAIKMHLAELYLSDGKFDAFEEQLSKIVLQLRGEGRATKLLQVVESFYERSNRHLSVLRRLAELYADLHQEERALELVRTGLAQDPEDRDLRLLALRANLAAGNLPEARRMALSLFHDDPRDLFILEQLASIARARGDSAELAQALRAIAKVHEVQGSPQERDASYRKLLELCPDDAEARLVLGDLAMEPVLSEGAGARPEVVDPIHEGVVEADLYLKYGLVDKAAEKLKELSERASDHVEVRQKLRDLYQRKDDREGWVREQLGLAALHARQGRESEALRTYQALLEVDPANASARQAISDLKPQMLASRPAEIEIDVDGETLELVRGGGQEKTDRKDEACKGADEEGFVDLQAEILDSHPDMSAGFTGFQDQEASELDEIVREFKSGIAEKLEEGDFETHYNLGLAYKEMGLLEDALHELGIAARSPEKSCAAYTTIALVYRDKGNRGDARAALQMALAVPTNGPQDLVAILYEMGELFEEEGDAEGARKAFGRAAQIDPAYRDLPQKARLLRTPGLE